MTSDSFRKVGRGGAGNFQPVTDVTQETVTLTIEQPGSVRAGRGGAGNYMAAGPGQDDSRLVTEAVARKKHLGRRTGGRGGAGNLLAGEDGQSRDDELHDKEALERSVLETVDKGLRVPARAHHGRERDVELGL